MRNSLWLTEAALALAGTFKFEQALVDIEQPNLRAATPSADNLPPEDEFQSANHSGNLRAIALVVRNTRTVGVHFGRRRILSTGERHAERDGLCRIHDHTLLRDRTADDVAILVRRRDVRDPPHRVDDRLMESRLRVRRVPATPEGLIANNDLFIEPNRPFIERAGPHGRVQP